MTGVQRHGNISHAGQRAIAILFLLPGCDRGGPASSPRVTQEAHVTVVTTTAEWLERLPEADLRPLFDLVPRTIDDSTGFLNVHGGAFLPGGRIAVADDGRHQLQFYSEGGASAGSAGRHGRGPDEYQSIRLVPGADRTVLATVDFLGLSTVVRDTNGVIRSRQRIPAGYAPLYRFADGSWLARQLGRLPTPVQEGTVRRAGRIVRLDSTGTILADFGTHPAEDYVLREGPRGPTGGEVPLGRQLLTAASDRQVLLGSTERFGFDGFRANGTQHLRLKVARDPTVIPEAFRRRFRDSVLARFGRDEYGKREWSLLTADDVFPRTFPEVDAIVVGSDGMVWVHDFSPDYERPSRWTVFDSNGLPLFRARLPGGALVLDVAAGRLLVLSTDADGLQSVRVFGFTRPIEW